MPIYKGKSDQAGAKIEEDPNNGYQTGWTPRFSEGIKDEDPLGNDIIKVFCVSRDDIMAGYKKLYEDKKMDFV